MATREEFVTVFNEIGGIETPKVPLLQRIGQRLGRRAMTPPLDIVDALSVSGTYSDRGTHAVGVELVERMYVPSSRISETLDALEQLGVTPERMRARRTGELGQHWIQFALSGDPSDVKYAIEHSLLDCVTEDSRRVVEYIPSTTTRVRGVATAAHAF